jgi:hypothetical protein
MRCKLIIAMLLSSLNAMAQQPAAQMPVTAVVSRWGMLLLIPVCATLAWLKKAILTTFILPVGDPGMVIKGYEDLD